MASIMHEIAIGHRSAYTPPSGVSQADYDEYLAAVGNAWWQLNEAGTGITVEIGGNLNRCGYDRTQNLAKLAMMPVREFRYTTLRHFDEGCGLENLVNCDDRWRALGTVLGWHAAEVDERLNDTALWFRPTNAGILRIQLDVLSHAWVYGLGALLAPFACAYGIFSSGDCGDASDYARENNIVDMVEGSIPGIGNMRDDMFTGLWHFIDVDSNAATEEYNANPGMDYQHAGPNGVPGVVDAAILVSSALSGLSLRYDHSNGCKNYGDWDEIGRSEGQWQAHSLGLTEFSPVDNLGQDGWNNFKQHPRNLSYLGGPLHALGDTAMPQHIASTTAWGHRPLEDAMGHRFAPALDFRERQDRPLPDTFEPGATAPQQILAAGYLHWATYRGQATLPACGGRNSARPGAGSASSHLRI